MAAFATTPADGSSDQTDAGPLRHLASDAEAQYAKALRAMRHILGGACDWGVFCPETLLEAERDGVPAPLVLALRESPRPSGGLRMSV